MTAPAHDAQRVRKLRSDEVLRMLEAGILSEDEPLELLDGKLVIVSPQGAIHLRLTAVVREVLRERYAKVGWMLDHSNIDAAPFSLPEPDVAVVRGRASDHWDRIPAGRDVLLAVEIAHTTHRASRAKAPIYAQAGVPVMWLIDIPGRCVEVHSGGPVASGDYAHKTIVDEGGSVDLPLVGGTLAVAELLPPAR